MKVVGNFLTGEGLGKAHWDGGYSMPMMDIHPPSLGRFAPPVSATDLKLLAAKPVDWLWNGYVARGATTLLTSLWKSGKTTLLAHLLGTLTRRESEFCGRAARGVKTLILSEESEHVWGQRSRQLELASDTFFYCRPLLCRPNQEVWRWVVDNLAALIRERGIGLVVIDPLATFIAGDENSMGSMLDFLTPLTKLTNLNTAVLLLHHPRKGGGDEGRASRGSGALPGHVDIIVEMRRAAGAPDTRRRVLTAYSRYEETPGELVIELAEDGSGFRAVGTRRELAALELRDQVVELLTAAPHGLTMEELRSRWPSERPPRATALDSFMAKGLGKSWDRAGTGTRGSPFRYFLIPESESPAVGEAGQ